MNEYEKQAEDFLKKTDSKIEITFKENGIPFAGDTAKRDIYNITISRGNRNMSFAFGNSINNSGVSVNLARGIKHIDMGLVNERTKTYIYDNPIKISKLFIIKQEIQRILNFPLLLKEKIIYPKKPTSYDILACLQKYDVGSFDNFCSEFGYDTDPKTAEKTYNAVVKEYTDLKTIYNDSELELLQEIQ